MIAATGGIQRVAIVGAGVMGTGIAELIAGCGLEVLLVARDREGALRARERIEAHVQRRVGAVRSRPENVMRCSRASSRAAMAPPRCATRTW